jgi:ATP-dependent helicase/nuclease subunit B
MHLTFGMHLDGTDWSPKQASMGEMQVGPRGLLDVLETHTGLTGLYPHPARRIDQYAARLRACDSEDAWFHRSFKEDEWSTAKYLLALRDELIGAGWNGTASDTDSPRLRALAEAERCPLPLAAGFEDRLMEVMRDLAFWKKLPISEILHIEPLDLLPPVWKKLFDKLKERGITIKAAPRSAPVAGDNNLATVQRRLAGDKAAAMLQSGDESLLLVEAGDEWEAAEHLARWLAAAGPDAGTGAGNADVTILCTGDSGVLDHALRRYGLPRPGLGESSRWRAHLQILPLVLANAWKPLDVHRLAELLTLELSPIPRSARYKLLGALKEQPGTGGEKWNKALAEIPQAYIEYAEQKGRTASEEYAQSLPAVLDAMLSTDRYPEKEGIPEEKLRERCQWVINAFGFRKDREEELREAIAQAREMQKLSEGKGRIPRAVVERMLDSVIGTGNEEAGRVREASPWRVITHPAQCVQDCGTLIWWNFTAQDPPKRTYWSPEERSSLKGRGAKLEDSASALRRDALGRLRALTSARDRVLLFAPARFRGEQVWPHAMWDEIRAAAKNSADNDSDRNLKDCLTRSCAALVRDGVWSLSGRSMSVTPVVQTDPPQPAAKFAIPAMSVPAPEHLSYSAMNEMIGCPMKWTLEKHAKLRRPDAQELPVLNLTIGNLCHHIVNRLYSEPGRKWTPADAERRAGELFDELVPAMASELLLQGSEVEQHRYRGAISRAVRDLVDAILRLKLTVESSEREIIAEEDGFRLKGFVDLVLRDGTGAPFVLDMKWSASVKKYTEIVEEGRALQLASYAWLLHKADGDPGAPYADGAYFLLAKSELLGSGAVLGGDALDAALEPAEIWRRGRRSWELGFNTIQRGELEAAGVSIALDMQENGTGEEATVKKLKEERFANELLYEKPPCAYCNYSALCGWTGGEE